MDGMIDEVVGARLSRAELIHPRIREAVRKRVESIRKDKEIARRMQVQYRAYGNQAKKSWPDAFLAIDEAVEGAIQRTAAGVRFSSSNERRTRSRSRGIREPSRGSAAR